MDNPEPQQKETAASGRSTSDAPWYATLASTLIGVMVGTGTQYFVTYQGIEKPKLELEAKRIDMENKKASVEGHKLVMALTPTVEQMCLGERLDAWSWRINCATKNKGPYHVEVKISEVALNNVKDYSEYRHKEGQTFKVDFPDAQRSFFCSPNSEGLLWFYITFDKSNPRYIQGLADDPEIRARITLEYRTMKSVTDFLAEQFPELESVVNDASKRAVNFHLDLPRPVGPAE